MLSRIYSSLVADNLKKDILIYSSAKNIVSSGIISLFVNPFFALLYYFLNFPLAAYFILLCGFIIFLSIITLKYVGSLILSRELFIVGIFSLLAWLSYMSGALSSPAVFWLILPPFLATKFGGARSAIFWEIMSILVLVILFGLEYSQYSLPTSPISDKLLLRLFSLAGLVMILFFLGFFFELSKQELTYELEGARDKSEFLFEKSQESARIKSEFLENLSHEFRTPLNIIQTSAEMLQPDNPEKKEFVDYIVRGTKDLTEMVDNMLDMSKFESGHMDFSRESIDLYHLIYDTQILHKNSLHEKHLAFTIQVDSAIKKVYVDPIRLRQVLSLYISNAVKFTREGGHIIVRGLIDNNQLKIEVTDDGIGIAKKDIEKLFAPFQQLDSSVKKKYKGTGIGLALVRRIIESQGGKVGVESTYGIGSTFFLILPFVPEKISP